MSAIPASQYTPRSCARPRGGIRLPRTSRRRKPFSRNSKCDFSCVSIVGTVRASSSRPLSWRRDEKKNRFRHLLRLRAGRSDKISSWIWYTYNIMFRRKKKLSFSRNRRAELRRHEILFPARFPNDALVLGPNMSCSVESLSITTHKSSERNSRDAIASTLPLCPLIYTFKTRPRYLEI